MNAQAPGKNIWFALLLLTGEYILLGWYLAAHHVFWLIGSCVVIATFAVIWKENPILDTLVWLIKQPIFVAIGISFLLSLLAAFLFINPVLLGISFLPAIVLLYASMEMRLANFKQLDIVFWAMAITGVGLGIGEAIDLFITPSMRY